MDERIGMQVVELLHERRQKRNAVGEAHPDLDRRVEVLVDRRELCGEQAFERRHLPREFRNNNPGGRWHHAGRRALVELHPKARLDVRDFLGQSGPRHVKPLRRLRQAFRLRNGHKHFDIVKLHDSPFIISATIKASS